MQSTKSVEGSKEAVRRIVHRCNNFLALVVSQSESALQDKTPETMEQTLRLLLEESERLEQFLRQSRKDLEA